MVCGHLLAPAGIGDHLMGFTDNAAPILMPISAESELRAAVHHGRTQTFVSVRGPCGEGHTMSLPEARALRDWLIRNVPSEATNMAVATAIAAQDYPEISEFKPT